MVEMIAPEDRPTEPPAPDLSVRELGELVRCWLGELERNLCERVHQVETKVDSALSVGDAIHEINNKLRSIPELLETIRGYANEVVEAKDQIRQERRAQHEMILRLELLESRMGPAMVAGGSARNGPAGSGG